MEAGWKVGGSLRGSRSPRSLARTWSPCRRSAFGAPRIPRGDGRIWLPHVPASSRVGGVRPALLGALRPAHGVSRVAQATVHSADLPGEQADALSSAVTGHSGNRSDRFRNARGVLGISLAGYGIPPVLPWLFLASDAISQAVKGEKCLSCPQNH